MRVRILVIFSVLCFWSQVLFALTDQELIAVRDGFEARRNSVLTSQVASPYPGVDSYVWNRQDFALSALYLNTQLPAANQAVIDACNALKNDPVNYDENFHWNGNLFYRIYKFFGHNSEYYPGRLTTAAEEAICDVFWNWAKYKSKLSDADYSQSQTWYIWGSENHDAMRKSTSYSAADILKDVEPYKNYTFDDGAKAAQHYIEWNAYFKEYIKERARKGLLVELGSHTYSKYTLQGWYNFYDFAPDAELRELAGNLLDLWWADWAQDQINAVRGGGKSRVYQDADRLARDDCAYSMCWFYLNNGTANSKHPGVMCLATSAYRLPLVVMDIALDTGGRGIYETRSRRPGLNLVPKPAGVDADTNALNPDSGGIYRYTYATPQYIIGTCMVQGRPDTDWSGISSQNRWSGVIFANAADSRIFPQCVGLVNGKTYNQYWSVQNKGTLITQKLTTSKQAGDMRVFFSGSATNMTITEEGGWVFARLPSAFAAVRPAWGTYTWDDANWMKFSVSFAPVIMEVAMSSDYSNSFTLFKLAVLGQSVNVVNNVLTYNGLGGSGTFTFYTNSLTPPAINGVTINFQPDYTFQSPFVNEQWDSGVVTITKGGREKVLDFGSGTVGVCGQWGYMSGDIDKDCAVGVSDLELLADQWFMTTDPADPAAVEGSFTQYGTYNIPMAAATPTIDGTLSAGEWSDAKEIYLAMPELTTPPNVGGQKYDVPTHEDFSGTYYMKWDAQYLYVGIKVYDNALVFNAGYPDDHVTLAFNPLKAGSAQASVAFYNMYRDGSGASRIVNAAGFNAAFNPVNAVIASAVQANGWSFEAAYKWSDFNGYSPAAGHEHGAAIMICDNDAADGVRDTFLFDSGSGDTAVLTKPALYRTAVLTAGIACGDMGYLKDDIDQDCDVNLLDYAEMAAQWLSCTIPDEQGCIDAR